MRTTSWRGLMAAAMGMFVAGTSAAATTQDLAQLLASQSNLTTFYALIQKYPQILLQLPSYSGVTILAPNNDAFNKIPYSSLNSAFKDGVQDTIVNVLEYHILQGTKLAAQLTPGTPVFLPTLLTQSNWTNVTGGQYVENVEQAGNVVVFVSGKGSRSTLTQADLSFTGGVVQIIDSVLIPPSNVTDTAAAFNLTSFEGALFTTGQNIEFDITPNVTIFAPANQGFYDLGPAITNMTIEELSTVLDYHILENQLVFSTSLTNGTKFLTKQGENITILHSGNNVYVNSAQLLQSDILVANGIIHVIDNVLNPQGPGAQPNPAIASQAPVFASASVVTYMPFTSAIPCTSDCPASTTSHSSTTKVSVQTTTSALITSSSKGIGAPMARETGFMGAGAMGLVAAIGGAVMMI